MVELTGLMNREVKKNYAAFVVGCFAFAVVALAYGSDLLTRENGRVFRRPDLTGAPPSC